MSRKKKTQNRGPRVRVTAPALSKAYEFNPDYTYVLRDLKRIGLLAGTFLAALVALSFFLG